MQWCLRDIFSLWSTLRITEVCSPVDQYVEKLSAPTMNTNSKYDFLPYKQRYAQGASVNV